MFSSVNFHFFQVIYIPICIQSDCCQHCLPIKNNLALATSNKENYFISYIYKYIPASNNIKSFEKYLKNDPCVIYCIFYENLFQKVKSKVYFENAINCFYVGGEKMQYLLFVSLSLSLFQ